MDPKQINKIIIQTDNHIKSQLLLLKFLDSKYILLQNIWL